MNCRGCGRDGCFRVSEVVSAFSPGGIDASYHMWRHLSDGSDSLSYAHAELQRRADIGTAFHNGIAHLLGSYKHHGMSPNHPDYMALMSSLMEWEMWWESDPLRIRFADLTVEQRLVGDHTCGEPDLLAVRGNGSKVLVDWKTGSISDRHKMQVAAYASLIGSVDEVYLVYVSPAGVKSHKVRPSTLEKMERRFFFVLDAIRA